MRVVVKLGSGSVHVGEVDIDEPDTDDIDDRRRTAAAVAWNALTRNGVFEVDGVQFDAYECAEWWA